MKKLQLLLVIIFFSYCACKKEDITVSFTTANQRFRESAEWNARNPFREILVPSDDYSILCMGDSHVGSTKNLDAFFGISKSINASAVVMAGDLTSGNINDYAVFQQHIPNQDSLPSFVIVGNHDLYYDGWNEFYSKFGSSTYLFVIETPTARDLFICLDSASGTLGNEQIDWLKKVLQSKRSMYRHCLVFTHNNFFLERHIESSAMSVDELNVLIEIFTVHKVDLVIAGHDHNKAVESLGNTKYIVMDALKDGLSNSGYLEINMKNNTLGYTFKNLQ